MKIILRTFVVMYFISLFSSCVHKRTNIEYIGDPSWSKVLVKSTLVIGVSDYVPILSFRNENNELEGYDIDIFKELCRRIGVQPIFCPINWEEKEMLLNSGKIDCIISGFSITEERKQRYLLTTPYLENVQVVATLTKRNYHELHQLKGKIIGIEAGTLAREALLSIPALHNSITIKEFPTIGELYSDLDNGSCDAIVVDLIYSCNMLDQNDKYSIINEAIANEYYTFAFRKGDKSLVEKVEHILREMNDDYTIPNFSKKWFETNMSIINVAL